MGIGAGDYCGLAIRADGTVATFGLFYPNYDTTPPAGLSGVVAVTGGMGHSLALKADGTLVSWGVNLYNGVTNLPPGLTNIVGISARDNFSLALRSDGTVAAWGHSTGANETSVPKGLSNVVAIATGDTHCLALKIDGTVMAWGDSSSGETTMPFGLNGVGAIGAGWLYSYAVRTNGSVVGWGSSTKPPAGISNAVAVVGSDADVLALFDNGSVAVWYIYSPFPPYSPPPPGLSNVVAIAAGDGFFIALGPNVPPQVSSISVTGAVNMDWTILLPVKDANNDALTCRIISLPTTGSLFQYTPAGRGDPITLPGTAVADAAGRVQFAPDPGTFGIPYSTFTFSGNDGSFDSPVGTLTVNIVPVPVVDSSSLRVSTNGAFSLSFAGLTNATYRIWASTNLTTWSALGAAVQSPPGVFTFMDTAATNWPRRFYRVSAP